MEPVLDSPPRRTAGPPGGRRPLNPTRLQQPQQLRLGDAPQRRGPDNARDVTETARTGPRLVENTKNSVVINFSLLAGKRRKSVMNDLVSLCTHRNKQPSSIAHPRRTFLPPPAFTLNNLPSSKANTSPIMLQVSAVLFPFLSLGTSWALLRSHNLGQALHMVTRTAGTDIALASELAVPISQYLSMSFPTANDYRADLVHLLVVREDFASESERGTVHHPDSGQIRVTCTLARFALTGYVSPRYACFLLGLKSCAWGRRRRRRRRRRKVYPELTQ